MNIRKLLCALLAVLLLLGLTACGGEAPAEKSDMAYAEESPAEKPQTDLSQNGSGTTSASMPTDRKLIRNISIEAETADLATLSDALTVRISQLGGYVESKDLYNGSQYSGYVRRTLSLTVRIPVDQADEFVIQVQENANIVSSTENVDDVTLQYVDTESHVKALETEQERLLALLDKAETLKDILTLEERLTKVRYELERYASQLRTLDNQVTYATIHLSITEVKEYTPVIEEEPTVWQRIATGFGRNLKNIGDGLANFFVWLVVNSPYLLIWIGIAAVIVAVLRKRGYLRPRWKKTPPPKKTTE